MTSKELCSLVNITEANLSVLRSGKAKGVRFHTINRICYFLQCDVGDILKNSMEIWRRMKMKIRKSKYHQNSAKGAHCGALIWRKFPINCDAHLVERFFEGTGEQASVKKFV